MSRYRDAGPEGPRGEGRRRVAALLLLLSGCAVRGPSADAGGNVAAALLSERGSIQPGRPFTVGLQMKIRRGWHIYWKNPGDSGLPPRITWELPEGLSAGPIEWPAPERIRDDALMSYGYRGEVLLPVEIVPPTRLAVDSVALVGTLEWLECADVCVPGSAVVRLSLPVRPEPPAPGPAAPSFASARSRIPEAPTGWALRAEAGPRAISLEFHDPPGSSPRGAYLFVDQPLVADYAAPQGFERLAGGYRLSVPPAPNARGAIERLTGVLVLEGGSGPGSRTAVQVDVPVARGDPAPVPSRGSPPPALIVVAAGTGLGLAILLLRFTRTARRKSRSRREPNG
ncbi:MAG TPA: protein-disulfide reductase DsbD domain-containing protein [Candidatus Eisenbacteria bacterium]